jgi:DNA-binding response OmpR family regulator
MLKFKDGEVEIDIQSRFIKKKGKPVDLTPREFEILASLMRRPNKVFTRKELIEIIIGKQYSGLSRVIDSHVRNLRAKLENSPKNPVYVITVHRVGYRFGGQRDTENKKSASYVSTPIPILESVIERQENFYAEF